MSKKKKMNVIKDLKRLGLVPTTKQYNQIMLVGGLLLFAILTGLAMYGAWKYPIPHHYYENMNFPANHYSNVADYKRLVIPCPICSPGEQIV